MTTILAYHQVDDRPDFAWNLVSPRALRRQMELLREGGRTGVPFREALDHGREDLVGITFDDAFAGVVRCALPILAEFGFRATLFVPTAWAGRPNRWDSRLVGRRARHAGWSELARAAARGWEIASHGATHRDLTALDDGELEGELSESRRAIRDETGKEAVSLAYPFGRTDARVIRAAGAAGFRHGCLAVPGGTGDRWRVGRVGVRRVDTPADFRAKIEGGALYPFQVWKDRLAHFCSRGTPLIAQRGGIR